MSYHLDKKNKRNLYIKYTIFVVILFLFVFFRASIFRGFSYVSTIIFRPVLIMGNNAGQNLSNFGAYFSFKKNLNLENKDLKTKLNEQESRIINYKSILDENLKLKEILGRKSENKAMILAAILSKPNRSPYDTLLVDVGIKNGIFVGQRVFAFGNIPIGHISEIYLNSSKVILYSNPGEKTDVEISGRGVFMQIIGRGNGNFEMLLPRDFVLEKGTEIVLPGITPHVIGIVQTIVSDPRDAFQKALIASPVNIQELKFVQVES